jgi:hypothetical protein
LGWVLGTGTYATVVLFVLALPGDNPAPGYVWGLAFGAMFPTHLAAILSVKAARSGRRLSMPWPRRAVIAVVAAYELIGLAALVVTVVTTPTGMLDGQPVALSDGRYALNNHGVFTDLTHAEYLRYLEVGERGFVGFALLFGLISTALVAGSLEYRSDSGPPAAQTVPPIAPPTG